MLEALAVSHFPELIRNPKNEFRFLHFSFHSYLQWKTQNEIKKTPSFLWKRIKKTERENFFSIFCFPFLSRTRNEVKSEHEKQKTYRPNGKPFRFAVFQFQNTGERKWKWKTFSFQRYRFRIFPFIPHEKSKIENGYFLQSFGFQYNIPVWDIRFQEHWNLENEQRNSQSLFVFTFAFFVFGKITKKEN